MIRRLFRWLADVPPSVSSFGRRLAALQEQVEEELDAMRQREENRRGQILTLTRMVTSLKGRMTDVENWLEGVDDEGDEYEQEQEDLLGMNRAIRHQPEVDELIHKRLTPRKEA